MKKLTTILAALALVAGVSSCKKDYTCACTGNGWEINIEYTKAKKKDAQASCDSAESTYKNGDSTASCTLN